MIQAGRRRSLEVCVIAVALAANALMPPAMLVRQAHAQDAGAWEFDAGEPGCQRVAIIFNIGMGYEPRMTVLDQLAATGVPATVFPMGWWARMNPYLVSYMGNDGFVVGSHGDQPIPMTMRGDWEIAQDVEDARASITDALGWAPSPYFTFYAADRDDRVRTVVANQGEVPVGFTVSADDWVGDATPMSVYTSVVNNIYDGAIVEFHLDAPNTAGSTEISLPWIVADLQAAGYTFVTVPEMASPC
jgi:peptidoglycan/xylan/chitin deacetylase (PgdA/CDA1 family)